MRLLSERLQYASCHDVTLAIETDSVTTDSVLLLGCPPLQKRLRRESLYLDPKDGIDI